MGGGGGAGSVLDDNANNALASAITAAQRTGAVQGGLSAQAALAASELAGEALRAQTATSLKVKLFCGCGVASGAPLTALTSATNVDASLPLTLEVISAQSLTK